MDKSDNKTRATETIVQPKVQRRTTGDDILQARIKLLEDRIKQQDRIIESQQETIAKIAEENGTGHPIKSDQWVKVSQTLTSIQSSITGTLTSN